MQTFDIGRFGKARLWIDEDINFYSMPSETTERELLPKSYCTSRKSSAALEVFLPRGARAEYGLLGGTFVASQFPKLYVRVGVNSESNLVYKNSLAGSADRVIFGLSVEHSDAILQAACEVAVDCLGPGLLTIDRAAHGAIGSSNRLFAKLASLVVFALGGRALTEESLAKLVG